MSHLAKAWHLEQAGDWIREAACVGAPPEWFFDQVHPTARELCAICPVRQDCLDLAIANDEQYGFWGGMTTHERVWEKRRRRVA